jgi:hypothetical protein
MAFAQSAEFAAPGQSRAQPAVAAPAANPANAPAASAPPGWSKQEIEFAQARCKAVLKGLDVVALPERPLYEATECGTPAPMKLLSIGKNPQVALSPPPTVTCDMIAALHKWVERDLQPLANKYLGSPVIRLETMSSYSCRNAYGRAHGKLSEHGRANALDIGAFITAKAQIARVIADWGPTVRDVEAQVAAAKAAAEKTAAAAAPSHPKPAPSAAAVADQSDTKPHLAMPGFAIGLRGTQSELPAAVGLLPANRLGGPKPKAAGPVAAPVPGGDAVAGRAMFLRAAHRAACTVFETTLGPEANKWHRNHFHVDMAVRSHETVICE